MEQPLNRGVIKTQTEVLILDTVECWLSINLELIIGIIRVSF